MDTSESDREGLPSNRFHGCIVPSEFMLQMVKVMRFCNRPDELSPVITGYIDSGDRELCWAGRDWQNPVIKLCFRMIIERGRKVIGVHIQLSAQVEVVISIGAVLVAFDMTEFGRQIVVSME